MGKRGQRRCFTRKKGYTRRGVSAKVTEVVNVEDSDGSTNLPEEPADVIMIECEEVEIEDSNHCENDETGTASNFVFDDDSRSNTCKSDVGKQNLSLASDHSYPRYNTDETQQSLASDHSYSRHNSDETQQSMVAQQSMVVPNSSYKDLKEKCMDISKTGRFTLLSTGEVIRFISVYDSDFPTVKVCVTVDKSFNSQIKVHNADLPRSHELWSDIPTSFSSTSDVAKALSIVNSYEVCQGNSDSHLVDLVPQGCFLDVAREKNRAGYKDNSSGVPTIRSTSCQFLVKSGRCAACRVYRRTLSKALFRQKERVETPKKNLISSRMPISRLSETQQVEKIKQLRRYANSLENEVEKLNRKLKTCIRKEGMKLNEFESVDMFELMESADKEMKASYPDSNSIQRLFWDQQIKYNKLVNKRCMRWHPMIVKWCIFLKSKSSTTYDTLRKTGFINLPSERTLHDYSHVLSKGVGYRDDIIVKLQEEVSHHENQHQYVVGLLQDEVKIRSDLVYDKNSGELIGFVDLDTIGNELQNIEEQMRGETKQLARYVLVVMVRGVSSRLKFPLAHFATNGITSDQLFPILWEAVQICEIDVGLKVLFITSDGASPNRRFIRLHEDQNQDIVYRAVNTFSEEFRYIYFISDAPHLIKTTRNNFSNSYSHKRTKKLWKNGRDISWLQIVDLYKENNSGLYRMCNKLSKNHVDLTSFSYMKVNLAAQVLSSTVANALEMLYGDSVKETVQFIRHMDTFFDLMNTRNFNEAHRKRNSNLAPFESVNDERLEYLTGEFLNYFKEWKDSVSNRQGDFTKSEKASMQLSYQTLEGLEITVKSVVECVKFCLHQGMPFVLTEKFNQDPIEQHFGLQRASCGGNTNPSVHEFNNTLQKLRTVGGQALAPLRGNTKRRLELNVDNTPLPKRPRN